MKLQNEEQRRRRRCRLGKHAGRLQASQEPGGGGGGEGQEEQDGPGEVGEEQEG